MGSAIDRSRWRWTARAARFSGPASSHEGFPRRGRPRHGQLRLRFAGERRRARLRLLRLARALRARPRGQAPLGEAAGQDERQARPWRGQLAGSPRTDPGRELGPRGGLVPGGDRCSERRGALAPDARRGHLLELAHGDRGRGPHPGGGVGHRAHSRTRPRHR